MIRARIAGRLRRAWKRPPGPPLRLTEACYGTALDIRNAAYDAGLVTRRRAPVPVVSVGGLTVGGSGKTPVAAEIAKWLSVGGFRTAVVTHGYADEVAVHRQLNPQIPVFGGRERLTCVRSAVQEGAEIAVIDSGFQHRRLRRDIDILALDTISLQQTNRRRLPAGAFRERITEVRRAQVAILVHRTASGGDPATLAQELRHLAPDTLVHTVCIVGDRAVAANETAAERPVVAPALALAGVMWPEAFFRDVTEVLGRLPSTLPLEDHADFGPALVNRIRKLAGQDGVICTLKDAVKLRQTVGADRELPFPIWFLAVRLEWGEDGAALRRSLVRACARLCRGDVWSP